MLQVPPATTGEDVRNARYAHAEGGAYGFPAHELSVDKTTDFENLGLAEFHHRVPLANVSGAPANTATLGVPVRDVLFLGSKKQVARIHATSIVALVQNVKATCDRTVSEFPRYPVGAKSLALKPKPAVSGGTLSACPFPAPGRDRYVRPEPFDSRGIHSSDVTLEYF